LYVGGRGFWFGEQATLGGGKLVASVVALTAVEVLLLPRAEFERIIEAEPRHYRRLALLGLQRSALLLRVLGGARRLSPEEDRVRLRLANLAELRRLEVTVVYKAVTLELSQTQLASILGLSRQVRTCSKSSRVQGRVNVIPVGWCWCWDSNPDFADFKLLILNVLQMDGEKHG